MKIWQGQSGKDYSEEGIILFYIYSNKFLISINILDLLEDSS